MMWKGEWRRCLIRSTVCRQMTVAMSMADRHTHGYSYLWAHCGPYKVHRYGCYCISLLYIHMTFLCGPLYWVHVTFDLIVLNKYPFTYLHQILSATPFVEFLALVTRPGISPIRHIRDFHLVFARQTGHPLNETSGPPTISNWNVWLVCYIKQAFTTHAHPTCFTA